MNSNLEIKKATEDDFDFYFNIKSEESNIYWTAHDKKPQYNSLKLWYINNLISLERVTYIILNGKNRIGYAYIDDLSSNKSFEISIAISEEFQNRGFGYNALKELLSMLKEEFNAKIVVAWIFEKNLASKSIFFKNGFSPLKDTKSVYHPQNKTNELMMKYILKF